MLNHRDLYTPDVLAGLEAFIAAQEEKDSLAMVANNLLRDVLTELGLIPYREVPEGEDDPNA